MLTYLDWYQLFDHEKHHWNHQHHERFLLRIFSPILPQNQNRQESEKGIIIFHLFHFNYWLAIGIYNFLLQLFVFKSTSLFQPLFLSLLPSSVMRLSHLSFSSHQYLHSFIAPLLFCGLQLWYFRNTEPSNKIYLPLNTQDKMRELLRCFWFHLRHCNFRVPR